MRKVMRKVGTHSYWDDRWSAFEADRDEFTNLDIYPIKYVDPVITEGSRTLEAGCGLGRVVKHYFGRGFDIIGCDYSSVAIQKIKQHHPQLDVREADITELPYQDEEFDNILTLGVFHGIEDLEAIKKGLSECRRCLSSKGVLVSSVRADTLENRIIDWVTEQRGQKGSCFHKWCFGKEEYAKFLREAGFEVRKAELVTNVCFLSKFRIFRKSSVLDEGAARSEGFRLNGVGNLLYKALSFCAPHEFGTTWVFTAEKT